MGRTPLVAPLLAVTPLPFPSLPTEVGAVAFTSANAVAALTGRPELQRLRALPVFAVGDATAGAARDLGFERVRSAGGDLTALGRLIAVHRDDIRGPVLHLAARERAGELADGAGPVVVTPVYQTFELPLDDAVRSAWTELDAILVHSPRAARALARAAAGLDLRRLTAVCISPAAATPLRDRWPRIAVAEAPNEAALLARLTALRQM
ncbi:MAG: uroporphyrinogen-III synthase [Proteobacteria bacterium]|nr:uroporphyrinogen-III synthase [Pseudomonadota bacterium]